MKIFLDTANVDDIREGVSWGIVDGVTTNPTLASKEAGNRTFWDIAKEIINIVQGPVNLEVTALDADGMVKEGKKLAAMGKNVVVKIPMTVEGLKAIVRLKKLGIKTNTTLIFNSNQALLAAKAGTDYVSPFVGRLDDIGESGMQIVKDILQIFLNYGIKTEIIVASVRHPVHVQEAALLGADIATVPFSILKMLVKHPKTDEGLAKFLEDWKKVKV
jgi:transaldolase